MGLHGKSPKPGYSIIVVLSHGFFLRVRMRKKSNASIILARKVLITDYCLPYERAGSMQTFSPYILSCGRCQLKRFPPFPLTSQRERRSLLVEYAAALERRIIIGADKLLSVISLPIIRQTLKHNPSSPRPVSQNCGAMSSGHDITHVLFDMDGLLLSQANSNPFSIALSHQACRCCRSFFLKSSIL